MIRERQLKASKRECAKLLVHRGTLHHRARESAEVNAIAIARVRRREAERNTLPSFLSVSTRAIETDETARPFVISLPLLSPDSSLIHVRPISCLISQHLTVARAPSETVEFSRDGIVRARRNSLSERVRRTLCTARTDSRTNATNSAREALSR